MHNLTKFCSKSSHFDEKKLMTSIDTILSDHSNNTKHNDTRWESIMDEIRDIDPYTTSNELNLSCCNFIGSYVGKSFNQQDEVSTINRLQKEGDPDIELGYLLYQNVIERSDNDTQIKEALLSKAYFAMLIKDKDNFNNTFDRVLTDFHGKLTKTELIFLYHGLAMIGIWRKMPQMQSQFYGVSMGEMPENLYDTWLMIQNVYNICQLYNFELPEFIPTDSVNFTSNFKVKSLKKRLKEGTLKGESEEWKAKFMDTLRDKNGELIKDPYKEWGVVAIVENGEYVVVREGALCWITPDPAQPDNILVGPYIHNRIHCGTQMCIGYDEESGISTWHNGQILLNKEENGNYVGTECMWVNRNDAEGQNLGRDLEYECEYVLEVE